MTDARRALPAVHRLLAEAERAGLTDETPHQLVVKVIREALDDARRAGYESPPDGWLPDIRHRLRAKHALSLIPLVNATGVVLHTNLGRAPLAQAAREAAFRVGGYTTLEYDLGAGERGSRQHHVRKILREVTGAEDALVVTNAAAATVLALNTLAEGGETIVSRGELVEIGGAFRIPAILEKSGTVLVEVGTTNRTRVRDYTGAISPNTRCTLKVHRSNFTLSGFVSEASLEELVAAMQPRGVPVVNDVGSGLLVDLSEFGLQGEPLVRDCVAAGAVVVCSGDKLLGGPQAGLILGREELVSRMGRNPLARALRPGKTVLAALEATLSLYRDRGTALREIPTLAMLTVDPNTLTQRAEALASSIEGASTEPGTSTVGGGAFPHAVLPTTLVAVPADHPDRFLARLRQGDPPVIARADEGRVLMDPRTVSEAEMGSIVRVVGEALC
jgi:L-seryl-tRNA(Ser) seleniumtransferase